jgi:heme/copper-type cytochrome/quinol oxidase subunit 1
MQRSMLLPVLFAAAGILFAVASLFAARGVTPGIDVFVHVHGSYFVVGHIHLLGIGTLVCLLYAGLYYVSLRVLHLTLSMPLSLVHFAITLLASVGLGNLRYLGLGDARPTVDNPLIGLLAINAITLMLVGSFLFFAIILLASVIKLRRQKA